MPPLLSVDWTDVAQTAWYEFIEQRPDYKTPYEPLPYTISFQGRRFFELYRRSQSPESSDDGSNHETVDELIMGRELSLRNTRAGMRIDNMLEDELEEMEELEKLEKLATGLRIVKVKALEMNLWPEEDYFQDEKGVRCRFVEYEGCGSC